MENILAQDEARRATQHESLKARVEAKVDSTIATQAQDGLASEEKRIETVATNLRRNLIDEVAQSERQVSAMRITARLSQVVDYAFGIIYALLAMRFLLALMAANERSGFVRLVKNLTNGLYAPFKNIVASPAIETGGHVALPLLLAMGVYAMLHVGIKGLLRLIVHRRTEI